MGVIGFSSAFHMEQVAKAADRVAGQESMGLALTHSTKALMIIPALHLAILGRDAVEAPAPHPIEEHRKQKVDDFIGDQHASQDGSGHGLDDVGTDTAGP